MRGNAGGKRKMSGKSQQKAIRRSLLILDQFARPGGLGEIFEISWAYLVLFFLITIWKSKPAGRPEQAAHSTCRDRGGKHLQRLTPHCAIRGSSALSSSQLRTLLWMPPGLKESHCHKGLKPKKFRKGFLEVASGHVPSDGYRNTLVKCEALFQLQKKEQCSQS